MIPENQEGVRILTEIKQAILTAKHKKTNLSLAQFSTKEGGELFPADIAALVKGSVVTKERNPEDRRQFLYDWVGGEPSVAMAKTINDQERDRVRDRMKRKREREGQEKEQEKVTAPAPAQEQVTQEVTPVQSNKEQEQEQAEQPPAPAQEVKTTTNKNVPISVEVTTEGDRKTVTIRIEV